jgi:glycosyltransferase involved in cell wall biosynthesis
MVVVWIPTGAPGWTLEAATPYHPRSIGGGIRSLYELAAAVASSGRAVELRGAVSPSDLDAVCHAAGARPDLPDEPRPPSAEDTVIVPEGIDDPAIHARLTMSPSRAVLALLGPPGLVGWPFTGGDWSPPDPLTVPLDAVARPEHFRAAAALGYEMWTHTPGMQRAAEAAGVACRYVGNGIPGGYPDPPAEKTVDLAWLSGNRWAPLAQPIVEALSERGVSCVGLAEAHHHEVLDLFGRARVVLHPLRIEGHSRIGCEARAMGAVPVVLNTNPFGVGIDEAGGAVAAERLSDMPQAVLDLLADPDRLALMSARARATASEQVAWEPFVSRVEAALDSPAEDVTRGARAAIGRAVAGQQAEGSEGGAVGEAEAASQGTVRRVIAAARHRGSSASKPRPKRFFREPRGYLDWPEPGTELERGPVNVLGWALFPGSSVERVEVSIAGGPPVRARLAVERPEIAAQVDHPDAPICAFEHKPDLSELPQEPRAVSIDVVAHAADGRRLELPPREVALVEPEPPFTDDGRAATLRSRSAEALRRRPPRQQPEPDRAIRLLAFTHTLGLSGGSLYLYELLVRLARAPGFECCVVAPQDGPLRRRFEEAGMPVHVSDWFPISSVDSYEGRLAELVAWCASEGFDAAFVNTIGSFPGADLATRLGIPAVWAIHESFPLREYWFSVYPPGALHPYVRARAERSLRETAAVAFVAEATRRLFLPHVDAERAVTVPYGIEADAIDDAIRACDRDAVRGRLGIAPDARVVLCLASIEPRKAQALLAQAFAQVADRHPHAVLALVGATADDYSAGYRAALNQYVQRAGLAQRVRIEPVTEDPFAWHVAADVVVCASDIESLPRSITEAMAFGTPVLSTRVFGVPELIQDGRSGWLCGPRDLGELAAGLDRALAASGDERRQLIDAAGGQVRTRHDAARQADHMLSLLRGLVDDPATLPGELLSARRVSAAT